jgi:hypothetical protein
MGKYKRWRVELTLVYSIEVDARSEADALGNASGFRLKEWTKEKAEAMAAKEIGPPEDPDLEDEE